MVNLMSDRVVTVHKGKIYAYRIFDVGGEVDLAHAAQILDKKQAFSHYYLRRTPKSIIISERPVVITLSPQNFSINGQIFNIAISAKLWNFGALSLQLTFNLEGRYTLAKLAEIGHFIETDPDFNQFAYKNMIHLVEFISPAITTHAIWSEYEDFLIYAFEKIEGLSAKEVASFLDDDITSLIFAERPMNFADNVKQSLAKHILQYGDDDLVLLHWNGAIIYDPRDHEEIADIIEFALCQLLELRYYDGLLDEQLNTLYKNIENRRSSILKNPYANISTQAALQYIDLSEIIDKVGNAFKTTGDFYYATIFRAATQRFYIQDWRASVSSKLSNLAEVSKLFQGEVNERRNQFMEAIIILLISIEVIPYIYSLLKEILN